MFLFVLCGGIKCLCTNREWCRDEYNSDQEFYRSDWNLTEVPPDIPAEALKVYLWGNRITSIPAGTFSHLTECIRLQLEKNLFTSINNTNFNGMESLELLWLWENKISFIESGSFSGLKQLTELGLEDNMLSTINVGIFTGLNSLKILHLQRNKISVIEPGSFDSLNQLTVLNLEENLIPSVKFGIFTGLNLLNKLYLNTNKISVIEEGSFDSLYSLNTIYFGGNEMNTMNADLFLNMPRPLNLQLTATESDTNGFICRSLCWLKHEESHGSVKFSRDNPRCLDLESWGQLQCGNQGHQSRRT